jgi:hypothetical protein
MVGTIAEVVTDKSTTFILKFKPEPFIIYTGFVVENLQYSEQIKLNLEP